MLGKFLSLRPSSTGSQTEQCYQLGMWVVATVADGVEKFADLLGRQPRQFTLLQLEQLHPGQRVVRVFPDIPSSSRFRRKLA
ncbi:hypothetical protein HMPREF3150_02721 [Pseudomonas aeruginosa]|nr:hypothetical protein HMPREF3150_02721 [Pseudomonas aeruginosa]